MFKNDFLLKWSWAWTRRTPLPKARHCPSTKSTSSVSSSPTRSASTHERAQSSCSRTLSLSTWRRWTPPDISSHLNSPDQGRITYRDLFWNKHVFCFVLSFPSCRLRLGCWRSSGASKFTSTNPPRTSWHASVSRSSSRNIWRSSTRNFRTFWTLTRTKVGWKYNKKKIQFLFCYGGT